MFTLTNLNILYINKLYSKSPATQHHLPVTGDFVIHKICFILFSDLASSLVLQVLPHLRYLQGRHFLLLWW